MTGSAPPDGELPDFDLTDDELRATGAIKWCLGWDVPGPVLPAWVAEMDVRPCPPVARALHAAVDRGALGYPAPDGVTGVPEATAALLERRFGLAVDPERVVLAGDVMAAVRLVLETLCEPAPVVVPLPTYPPFLDVVPLTGRVVVPVPLVAERAPDGGLRPALDLTAVGDALAAGARTVLLSSPHNPTGRVWERAELEGLRDVAARYGARVVSDEVHAPLTLPGATHVPYASLPGTAGSVTTVLSASKPWNVPGVKCAQVVAGNGADLRALRAVPVVANHGVSPLGVVATLAAYTDGGRWLDGVVAHVARERDRLGVLLAGRAPHLAWRPMEASYLAWVDAAAADAGDDPAGQVLRRSGVAVGRGRDYGRGSERFVRITLATAPERLGRIVDGLATALAPSGD